jgi:hypothetical protein
VIIAQKGPPRRLKIGTIIKIMTPEVMILFFHSLTIISLIEQKKGKEQGGSNE